MHIYRCSICGYIYKDKQSPCECPFCRNKEVFDQIEEKNINVEFFKDAWARQVKWMNNTKYQNEIKLNPNQDILFSLAEAMVKSLLDKNGQAYCPCRVLSGKKLADKKIICPCYLYMGEIEIWGRCQCALYVTPEWVKKNK